MISQVGQTAYDFAPGTFGDMVTVAHVNVVAGHVPSTGSLAGVDRFFDVNAVHSQTREPVQPAQPDAVTAQYHDAELGPAI